MATFLCVWLFSCTGTATRCTFEDVNWSGLRAVAPVRAHVRYVSKENDLRLDVVIRMNGDELVVVGLTHYGVRLFLVRQLGESTHVEGAVGIVQESLPLQVVDALGRTLGAEAVDSEVRGESASIRYARASLGTRLEIHRPQCGYAVHVVEISEKFPVRKPGGSEGVEP